MILPENKNKKYVKVVIGVYILFCIISPVVGKNLELNEFNLEEYIQLETNNSKQETNLYDSTIRETFKNKVILNIKSQLESKGYESNNIDIEIDEECKIKKIKILDVYENKKDVDGSEENDSKIVVNKVETNIESVDIKDRPTVKMAISDKESLIDYLVSNYQIDKKNIIIE